MLSSDWVRLSVTPAIAVGPNPAGPWYGLKWWLFPDATDPTRHIWSGSGFGGQVPMAFPDHDLVVVFNGWNILPGRPSLPRRTVQERLTRAVVGK